MPTDTETLYGRPIRPVTAHSWRRGQGWFEDGMWHYYFESNEYGDYDQACIPGAGLRAGAIANESDPLCPKCVAIATGKTQP